MANKEVYIAKANEFCELHGINTKNNAATIKAIYDRIQGDFTNSDVTRAFEEMSGLDIVKLNYPTVKRYLCKYREIRMSMEQKNRKAQEKTATEAILSNEEIQKLVNGALDHTLTGLKRGVPGPNAVYVKTDGARIDAWVDINDPALEDAVRIVYEQAGENSVRASYIDLAKVAHRLFTKREDTQAPRLPYKDADDVEPLSITEEAE